MDAPAPPASMVGAYGIPATVLDAYRRAAASADQADPGCHLDWALVAAIGKVESDHAENGDVLPNGDAFADLRSGAERAERRRRDPRRRWLGASDGTDAVHPVLLGGMGADGNGDGRKDPQNVYDATLAAAHYLCSGRDLSTLSGIGDAVYAYNHSQHYVDVVLSWYAAYQQGVSVAPDQLAGYVVPNGADPSSPSQGRESAPPPPAEPAPQSGPPPRTNPGPGAPPATGAAPTPTPTPTPAPPMSGLLPAPVASLLPAPIVALLPPAIAELLLPPSPSRGARY